MAAILVIASNSVRLIRGRRQRSMLTMNTKRIIRSGVFLCAFNLYNIEEQGKAPSLAIAKPILEVTVILLNPAKNILTISSEVNVTAPAFL